MRVASRMSVVDHGDGRRGLKTSTGLDVVFQDDSLARPLCDLEPGVSKPVADLFEDPEALADDLVLLHRNGAIELRLWESPVALCPVLRDRELAARGEYTTPEHQRAAP
jgi:hypothetical protein